MKTKPESKFVNLPSLPRDVYFQTTDGWELVCEVATQTKAKKTVKILNEILTRKTEGKRGTA